VNDVAPVMPNFGRLGLRHAADAPGLRHQGTRARPGELLERQRIDLDVVARTYTLPFALFNSGNGDAGDGPGVPDREDRHLHDRLRSWAPRRKGNLSLITQEIPLETM